MSGYTETGAEKLAPTGEGDGLHRLLASPRFVTLLLAFILGAGFLLRVLHPDVVYFNIHAERDIWRTVLMLEGREFPWRGSELSQGGYSMGPALYFLQVPPLAISRDPRLLLFWLGLLHVGAIWLCWRIGREWFTPAVGLAAAALFATFPLAVLALRYLWNPSYIFPLSAAFFWCLGDWLFRRRTNRVPLMVGAIGVLAQVHLSGMLLLLLAVVSGLVFRAPVTRGMILKSLAILFFVFSPYIVGDMMNGFENTRAILNPPEKLNTVNEAQMEVGNHQRFLLNKGAMMAFQVALSPVFYDCRFLTGSFSYLHLLAQYGPTELSPLVFRWVFLLHQSRWLYIFLYVLLVVLALLALFSPKVSQLFARPEAEDSKNGRNKALLFILAFVICVLPMFFIATLQTVVDGKVIGGGAIRYFFILYPLPFLMLALMARTAVRAIRTFGVPRALVFIPVVLIVFACVLQASTVIAHLETARRMDRSFKYSLHEAYTLNVQRRAVDILIDEWGVTPRQYKHSLDSIDYTFCSTAWNVPSLEQTLDYLYFTHKRLDLDQPAKHPDCSFLLFDSRRTPEPDLSKYEVEERRDAGGLVLLRVTPAFYHEHSPVQNPWLNIGPAEVSP